VSKMNVITNIKNNLFILNKISLIVGFSILNIALLIVHDHPAVKYESSIYVSTPLFFWIAILVSFIIGLVNIAHGIYSRKKNRKQIWLAGIILLYLVYISCLSLFIIRGYYMWCISGDPATHIGYVKSILLEGFIPKGLFYPFIHIFVSILNMITNINLISLHKFLPLYFSIIYTTYVYLCSKAIFKSRSKVILTTVLSLTFTTGWNLNFSPNGLANNFFPLSVYLILNTIYKKDSRWNLLALIIVFIYPIFHAIPSLILLIILIFGPNSSYLFLHLSGFKKEMNNNLFKCSNIKKKYVLSTILLVSFISWISSFYIWSSAIQNLNTILTENGPSNLVNLENKINYATDLGYNVFELIMKSYISVFIYTLFFVFSLYYIQKNFDSSKHSKMILFVLPSLITCLCIIVFYLLNLNFGPLRLIFYIVFIFTFFVGFYLDELITQRKYSKKSILLTVFLIFIIFSSGLLQLYPSKYLLVDNYHTTKNEVNGMNWFFENRNINLDITGIHIFPRRFAEFFFSMNTTQTQTIPRLVPEELNLPYHFGEVALSSYYLSPTYFLLPEKDEFLYKDTFSEIADKRWNESDFNKLNNFNDVDKVYYSDGFIVYYIRK